MSVVGGIPTAAVDVVGSVAPFESIGSITNSDILFIGLLTVRTGLYYAAIYGVVIAVAAWIYRDARDHGIGYPSLWALATLVLTIIPVLIYLYVRRRSRRTGDTGDR
ncbi:hypothetical protein ACERIT_14725 [Halopenitus sp. H-Gu1]|uniref:hypothetical protein n=1 Tax=Halopenitus sp. H-Gu1 TaxID=3242697 RepID=UPI00359E9BE2